MRDPALPYARRVMALLRCIELYRPIGFQATIGFLENAAGPFRRDEQALLRGLEMLESSRAKRHSEVARYDALRRRATKVGRRNPRKSEPHPNTCRRWYGAEREAALHVLQLWRHRFPDASAPSHRLDADLLACVNASIEAGGDLAVAWQEKLTLIRSALQELAAESAWPGQNFVGNWQARERLLIVEQLGYAQGERRTESPR